MGSLPNSSNHLSVTPIGHRTHRHRRSAAISGEFDSMGLGLFSPSPTSKSLSNININNSCKSEEPEFEKSYNFNNYEDFASKISSTEFAFPANTPDLSRPVSGLSPRHFNAVSPGRKPTFHSVGNSLNSPIKLNHKRASSHNVPSTANRNRFFLTEETTLNNENVPEAVIDLDEILNANLHIGEGYASSNTSSTSLQQINARSEMAVQDVYSDDDFLASPFVKQASSPFVSSPLTTFSNTTGNIFNHYNNTSSLLFNQPIQESTGDLMEEEEEEEEEEVAEDVYDDPREQSLEYLHSDNEINNDVFANLPPNHTLGNGIYSNLSANSSSSSLRSASNKVASSHLIEKTFSNSSKDSTNSNYTAGTTNAPTAFNNSTPSGKRSGAKANRYQIFYDQSNRISNALKVSSSESINIVRSNSSGNNLTNSSAIKESRSLGHSSSLPSLKSNPKRVMMQQRHNASRLGDLRTVAPEYSRVPSPPINLTLSDRVTTTSPTAAHKLGDSNASTPGMTFGTLSNNSSLSENIVARHNQIEKITASASAPKAVSVSPISVTSENSSTVISSNETIQSTDDSSSTSHSELVHGKAQSTRGVSKSNVTSISRPAKESNSVQSTFVDREANITPSIVISSGHDGTSSPSTSSTFKQDYFSDDMHSQNAGAIEAVNTQRDSSIQTMETNTNSGLSTASPVSQHFTIHSIENSGEASLKSSKSSLKTSSKSSPKKPAARRPLSSSEEKILKLTLIPAFKSSPLTKHQPSSNQDRTRSLSSPSSAKPLTSDPVLDVGKGKLKPNFNPFFSKPSDESTSNKVLAQRDSGTRRGSITNGGRDTDANQIPRRGSTAFSIVSQPATSSSIEASSSSIFRVRHSKSKSFSLSTMDLRPHLSKSSGLPDRESDEHGKRKTSKFIHWFKRGR